MAVPSQNMSALADGVHGLSAPPLSAAGSVTGSFKLDPGLSRFATVLLAYVVALAALATLSPFDFDFAAPHGIIWESTPSDVVLNLGFLFPVGFLLRLSRPERGWPLCLDALLLGACLSAALELMQSFLPTRVTSPTDVMTNSLGAWTGGIVHSRIGPFLDRRLQKQLSLHLPLANLLYLAVPLLSLDALAMRERFELLADIPLALFMAFLAAGLYKHRLEGSGQPFSFAYAAAIGLVFGIGWLPLCAHSFELWCAGTLGMTLLTRVVIAVGTRLPQTERRFVPFTIQRALPFLLLYLFVLGARAGLPAWLMMDATGEEAVIAEAQLSAFVLLRDVAAFTLLGYVLSELHARSTQHLLILLRVAAMAGVLAVGFLFLQRSGWAESGLLPGRASLLAGAALAGGSIHRAQLRLVRSWTRPPKPVSNI